MCMPSFPSIATFDSSRPTMPQQASSTNLYDQASYFVFPVVDLLCSRWQSFSTRFAQVIGRGGKTLPLPVTYSDFYTKKLTLCLLVRLPISSALDRTPVFLLTDLSMKMAYSVQMAKSVSCGTSMSISQRCEISLARENGPAVSTGMASIVGRRCQD